MNVPWRFESSSAHWRKPRIRGAFLFSALDAVRLIKRPVRSSVRSKWSGKAGATTTGAPAKGREFACVQAVTDPDAVRHIVHATTAASAILSA